MCVCNTCAYLDYAGNEEYKCLKNEKIITDNDMQDLTYCNSFVDYIREEVEFLVSRIERLLNKKNIKHYLEYNDTKIDITIYIDNIDIQYFSNRIDKIIYNSNLDNISISINNEIVIKYF